MVAFLVQLAIQITVTIIASALGRHLYRRHFAGMLYEWWAEFRQGELENAIHLAGGSLPADHDPDYMVRSRMLHGHFVASPHDMRGRSYRRFASAFWASSYQNMDTLKSRARWAGRAFGLVALVGAACILIALD